MKINKILISQPEQAGANPHYTNLVNKYGVIIDFRPFFKLEPLSLREFRTQKINIPDYTAIVFTAKASIDAFFQLCEEQRYKVPESLKYFCIGENIAYYLQKHIVYRKRKIFFGDGTFDSIVKNAINEKHRDENFLIATADHLRPEWSKIFEQAKLKFSSAVFVKVVNSDLKTTDLSKYQLIAFYSALDVASLKANYPEYKQGDTMFVTFGNIAQKAMQEANLRTTLAGPVATCPSMASAIEYCINNTDALVSAQTKGSAKKAASVKKVATIKKKASVKKSTPAKKTTIKKAAIKETTCPKKVQKKAPLKKKSASARSKK
ncbi:MAG TPA: uroporphyrinogen-III synthase [Candidatus Egerieousia sp.]|nr:uroporphyrinogen-III synthase [Candidatus Egerieousia sp.]HPT05917.1 uroporphyrinogen-III synthase [Candidatus Egerieousia sp.]